MSFIQQTPHQQQTPPPLTQAEKAKAVDACDALAIKIGIPIAVLFLITGFTVIGLAASHHLGSSLHSMSMTHLPPSPAMQSIFHNYSYIGS